VPVRAAAAALDPTRHHVVYVSTPSYGCRGLYVSIVAALGGIPRFRKPELIAQTAALLAAEEAERHRRVTFVLDEAHLLTPDQLEELRLLTNAEFDSREAAAGAGPFRTMLAAGEYARTSTRRLDNGKAR
jgi:type II secretory pathway predicted ATPase ExeA